MKVAYNPKTRHVTAPLETVVKLSIGTLISFATLIAVISGAYYRTLSSVNDNSKAIASEQNTISKLQGSIDKVQQEASDNRNQISSINATLGYVTTRLQ